MEAKSANIINIGDDDDGPPITPPYDVIVTGSMPQPGQKPDNGQ